MCWRKLGDSSTRRDPVKVRFTSQAERQFLAEVRYLLERDRSAARAFHERAVAIADLLRQYPAAGYVIPELPDLPHREVSAPPYRFFYRVVESTVWIIAVWHSRQRPDEPTHERPEGTAGL